MCRALVLVETSSKQLEDFSDDDPVKLWIAPNFCFFEFSCNYLYICVTFEKFLQYIGSDPDRGARAQEQGGPRDVLPSAIQITTTVSWD